MPGLQSAEAAVERVDFELRRQLLDVYGRRGHHHGLADFALYRVCVVQNFLASAPKVGADVQAMVISRVNGNFTNTHTPTVSITNGFSKVLF